MQEVRRNADQEMASAVDSLNRLLAVKGNQTIRSFHRRLGAVMWDYAGMSRNDDSSSARRARSTAGAAPAEIAPAHSERRAA